MSGLLNLVWLLLVVSLLAWALGNVAAIALGALPSSRSIRNERHRLWLLAALPWVFPPASAFSFAALSLARALNWIDDHCRATCSTTRTFVLSICTTSRFRGPSHHP